VLAVVHAELGVPVVDQLGVPTSLVAVSVAAYAAVPMAVAAWADALVAASVAPWSAS